MTRSRRCARSRGPTASTPFCTIVEWHRLERAGAHRRRAGRRDEPGRLAAAGGGVAAARRRSRRSTSTPFGRAPIWCSARSRSRRARPDRRERRRRWRAACSTTAPGRWPIAERRRAPPGRQLRRHQGRVRDAARRGRHARLYEVTLDAAHTCTKITDGNGQKVNGLPVDNLDPMYAPDGTLVFASTRGKAGVGPTRSPKYLLPQTDLLAHASARRAATARPSR